MVILMVTSKGTCLELGLQGHQLELELRVHQ